MAEPRQSEQWSRSTANYNGRSGPGQEEDQTLFDRMKQGSTQALDALYDRYQASVYAVARRILQHDADAEEVVLETFWQLWSRPERYDASRGSVSSFLLLLGRSRALDKRRKRHTADRAVPSMGEMNEQATPSNGPAAPPPDEPLRLQERRQEIQAAMQALSEPQQEALQLAFFEGLTHQQIAQQLNIPMGTVKTRLRQGMIRLRDSLGHLAEETAE
jgi:RNA polymerase sigma-70 factor (ECF subfamily)